LDELDYWNKDGKEYLMKQLRLNRGYVVIDLPGRKKSKYLRPFKSIIGGDALNALSRHLARVQQS
jgi:hypothetical protein